jgi:hypothetical protein
MQSVAAGWRLQLKRGNQMKAQATATHPGGWTILADFARTIGVALVAGVFFSLLSGLLVIIVSTID